MEIHDAAVRGDLEAVRAQLGDAVDVRDEHGRTPLHFAAGSHVDTLAVATHLLDRGAAIEAETDFGDTPLTLASEYGNTAVVRALLEAGARVDTQNSVQTQAIDVAGNIEIARMLVQAGADLNFVNGQGFSLLFTAAQESAEFTQQLLALGADTEATSTGDTALHAAVIADNIDSIRVLLAHGANVNAPDVDGWVPISRATSVAAAKWLLEHGARLDLTDDIGHTPLQQIKHKAVLEFLLENGSDVNHGAGDSSPPLVQAAEDGDLDRVRMLLEHGADPNATDEFATTALMAAAEGNHADCVRTLLAAGATVDARDDDGRTALFRAAAPEDFMGYEVANLLANPEDDDRIEGVELTPETFGWQASDSLEIVEMLVAAGADPNARDEDGMTPLMTTASAGRPSRVAALLRLGAHPGLEDEDGNTAKDWAEEHEDPDLRAQIERMLP